MKVFLVNNLGGGFAENVDIAPGTTIDQFFSDRVRDARPGEFLIRVNRRQAVTGQVLEEGDRIAFVPVQIEGAGW